MSHYVFRGSGSESESESSTLHRHVAQNQKPNTDVVIFSFLVTSAKENETRAILFVALSILDVTKSCTLDFYGC